MLFMITKIFFLIGFITSQADTFAKTESEACPDGWETIHRGCYQFVTDATDWAAAKDYCKQQHGELTSIQSVKEKQGLEKYLGDHYGQIKEWWIGFKREGDRGTNWNWLANIPVNDAVTPWWRSSWKRRPGAFCGVLHLERGLKVHIARCTSSLGFICEFHTITDRPSLADAITEAASDQATTVPTPPLPQNPAQSEPQGDDCPCRETGDAAEGDERESLARGMRRHFQAMSLANDDDLFQRYLQSEVDANNARVAYYTEVSRMYQEALEAQNQYYNSYQTKLDLEIEQMRQGSNCI